MEVLGCQALRDGVVDSNFDGSSDAYTFRSASFGLNFQGETTTETITLYARAPRGEVNYSNNPTFVKYNQQLLNFTSSHVYEENKERLLKNIVTSSFGDYEEKFRRQVYISKIGVYDEQKNLIGIATLANPILKDENQDFVFKLKDGYLMPIIITSKFLTKIFVCCYKCVCYNSVSVYYIVRRSS